MPTVKIEPRATGIAASFTALATMFIIGAGAEAWLLIIAILANMLTVTLLIAQLVNSKATFFDEVLRINHGFKRREIAYANIQKIIMTKRGVMLWREPEKPMDIWIKPAYRDDFLEHLYKHDQRLRP